MKTNPQFSRWLALSIFLIAIALSARVQAVTFTSSQSGSWGNAATWGGAGVPGCADDVIIATGHTVALDANRCANNLTISSSATLDLAGFEMTFSGNGVTFTNNGTFANSGSFNRLVSANGGANQTLAGTGTYSGNLKLENVNVNWNIAAGTTFTFNSATNNINLQMNAGNINVNNSLTIIAPSAGANYVIFDKQGGSVNASGIRTQGNVRIKTNSNIGIPIETVSGAAQAEGYFGQGWMVDSGASLALSGGLTVSNINGGNGLIVSSNASIDLAGNQLNIAWNGPFTNNGTVNNSGAFNRIVFMDQGTHAFSGTGTYSGNVGLEALNNTTNIAAGSSLTFGAPAGNTNIQVDAGATLNFAGPNSLTLSGEVLNNGALNMNSGGPACDDATRIVIRSSVAGTQRAWNGNGMSLKNLDVSDQAGSAPITVINGINSGNNGPNWNINPCAPGSPTPTPTPPPASPTPTPPPSPTPAVTPSQLLNIATRMRVQTGENVMIAGFIINGADPKTVIIRGIGPSLAQFFSGTLANPTLELFQGSTLLQSNNDWRETQQTQIQATGLAPTMDFESAILRTLPPGAYTAVLRGLNDTAGIAVVEAYDLDAADSKLANIATRGFVEAGDNVMIGGLIIGPASGSTARVVVRAIGPSLTAFGIAGALQDPTVELKDASGTTLSSNDDWQQGQPAELQQLGLAPTDPRESALVATLAPGSYTAIVRGAGNTTGVALVEVYHVQ